jgi:3-oxo-5,6-didehydrosuberyl-CoA/3-oxoadipyl-CoA thiolase
LSGDGDLFIAGGVESMTRAPFVMAKSASAFSREINVFDTSIGWRFVNPSMRKMYGVDNMGETAENVATRYNISREDQDLFAFNSQTKAADASDAGRFSEEILAIEVSQGKKEVRSFSKDEFIKPDTTLEKLASLRPAFRDGGTVTAGNASGINDGAAALLIASERFVSENKLTPLARFVSSAVSGVEPAVMGIGPVTAARLALSKAGLGFDDISVIELNEAFAAQALACIREWGLSDNDPRVNPNGGAIAIGHPLGMSGTRLLLTAAHELHRRKGKYALCTMCIGVGQGLAVIYEKL